MVSCSFACSSNVEFKKQALMRLPWAANTIQCYKEFDKYLGQQSDVLVKNLYMKITLLRKLINAGKLDQDRKLKALFHLLMLVHFHLANKPLPKAKTNF
jgi:hypothetical protein